MPSPSQQQTSFTQSPLRSVQTASPTRIWDIITQIVFLARIILTHKTFFAANPQKYEVCYSTDLILKENDLKVQYRKVRGHEAGSIAAIDICLNFFGRSESSQNAVIFNHVPSHAKSSNTPTTPSVSVMDLINERRQNPENIELILTVVREFHATAL